MARRKRGDVSAKSDPERIDEVFSIDLDTGEANEKTGDESDALPPVAAHIFETEGNVDFPKLPDMRKGFHEIVRDVFDNLSSVYTEYEAIRDSLVINGALTPDAVNIAANRAESIADRAYKLYCVAQVEYEAYVREIETVEAAMRDGAMGELERQKANKSRTKQITDADVRAEISQRYPDEWNDVQTRKSKAELMAKYLSNLSTLATKRCFSLSRMQRD